MLWNNGHLERSQSEVERSIEYTRLCVITFAVDLSTAFTSLSAVNFVQDDIFGFTKVMVEPIIEFANKVVL